MDPIDCLKTLLDDIVKKRNDSLESIDLLCRTTDVLSSDVHNLINCLQLVGNRQFAESKVQGDNSTNCGQVSSSNKQLLSKSRDNLMEEGPRQVTEELSLSSILLRAIDLLPPISHDVSHEIHDYDLESIEEEQVVAKEVLCDESSRENSIDLGQQRITNPSIDPASQLPPIPPLLPPMPLPLPIAPLHNLPELRPPQPPFSPSIRLSKSLQKQTEPQREEPQPRKFELPSEKPSTQPSAPTSLSNTEQSAMTKMVQCDDQETRQFGNSTAQEEDKVEDTLDKNNKTLIKRKPVDRDRITDILKRYSLYDQDDDDGEEEDEDDHY